MVKKFYKQTGMYIDWKQINKLPNIKTLIDIGVGPNGTPDLYTRFTNSKLILIDPLDEAKSYAENLSKSRNVLFYQNALGKVDERVVDFNIQKKLGNSSLLKVSKINYKSNIIKKTKLKLRKLDSLLKNKKSLGSIGIKIDVEGFELDVIKGASKTLKKTKFLIAEVRHNHKSFKKLYKLYEFINLMDKNHFILTMILTAKPFISDLCFQPRKDFNLKIN
jgi:FkbM family methyltransferase